MNIISSHCIEKSSDHRTFYQIVVAWDSSLHNSNSLNRCTSNGNAVYLTISSYIEFDQCIEPVIVSKDLCLVLYPRAADVTSRFRFSLRNFLFYSTSSTSRTSATDPIVEPTHCISAIYELKFRRIDETTRRNYLKKRRTSPGSERRLRKVVDTSKIYVRGEEMLKGWRPRSDSLIVEHQENLEKLFQIESVRFLWRD